MKIREILSKEEPGSFRVTFNACLFQAGSGWDSPVPGGAEWGLWGQGVGLGSSGGALGSLPVREGLAWRMYSPPPHTVSRDKGPQIQGLCSVQGLAFSET